MLPYFYEMDDMGHRPGWLKHWTISPDGREASHSSGAVFRFGLSGELLNGDDIARTLTARHGVAAATQMLLRLTEEAKDARRKKTS